jgi:hypothetical protein
MERRDENTRTSKAAYRKAQKGQSLGEDMARELNELLHVFGSVEGVGNYREKINGAIEWADIYFSPQKSDRHGGREIVRASLLQDLGTAAEIAGQLQDV